MRLRPSKAHVWVSCPGYVRATSGLPSQPPNEAAKDGLLAHEIGACMIKSAIEGRTYSPPETASEEVVTSAKIYADYVIQKITDTNAMIDGYVSVEERLPIPDIHEDCEGVVDSYIYTPGELDIFEFKNGRRPVSARKNWQMLTYLSALMSKFKLTGLEDQNLLVRLHVIQPNSFAASVPFDVWAFRASDERGSINKLRAAAKEAVSENPTCKTGEHCYKCAAIFRCKAAQDTGSSLIECLSNSVSEDPDPDELGFRLMIVNRAYEHINNLKGGLEEEIKHLLRSGTDVKGYGLAPAYGRESWIAPVEDIIALGNASGIDLNKPGTITPKQAIKKGLDPELVQSLTTRPQNGFKLDCNINETARRIFG